MITLKETIDAMMASADSMDIGSQHRLQFWQAQLGHLPLQDVTADDVDNALDVLVQRGKLKAGRGLFTQSSGKPLSPSTLTRYVATLGGVYRYAKRTRLVRKSHISPTRGVETHASPVDRNKFMTPAGALLGFCFPSRLMRALIVVNLHEGAEAILLLQEVEGGRFSGS